MEFRGAAFAKVDVCFCFVTDEERAECWFGVGGGGRMGGMVDATDGEAQCVDVEVDGGGNGEGLELWDYFPG